eukprot:4240998-Amphidinium_carterae.1
MLLPSPASTTHDQLPVRLAHRRLRLRLCRQALPISSVLEATTRRNRNKIHQIFNIVLNVHVMMIATS